jgi:hypothetical protein
MSDSGQPGFWPRFEVGIFRIESRITKFCKETIIKSKEFYWTICISDQNLLYKINCVSIYLRLPTGYYLRRGYIYGTLAEV